MDLTESRELHCNDKSPPLEGRKGVGKTGAGRGWHSELGRGWTECEGPAGPGCGQSVPGMLHRLLLSWILCWRMSEQIGGEGNWGGAGSSTRCVSCRSKCRCSRSHRKSEASQSAFGSFRSIAIGWGTDVACMSEMWTGVQVLLPLSSPLSHLVPVSLVPLSLLRSLVDPSPPISFLPDSST